MYNVLWIGEGYDLPLQVKGRKKSKRSQVLDKVEK